MKLDIRRAGGLITSDAILANTFWARLSGYMFRKTPHVPGLLFEPSSAIHTSFMKFDLDLVFLSKENQVVKILWNVKPWRHTRFYFKARKTLEAPTGVIPTDLKEGDILEILEV